jgi:hypothetical protein
VCCLLSGGLWVRRQASKQKVCKAKWLKGGENITRNSQLKKAGY